MLFLSFLPLSFARPPFVHPDIGANTLFVSHGRVTPGGPGLVGSWYGTGWRARRSLSLSLSFRCKC